MAIGVKICKAMQQELNSRRVDARVGGRGANGAWFFRLKPSKAGELNARMDEATCARFSACGLNKPARVPGSSDRA